MMHFNYYEATEQSVCLRKVAGLACSALLLLLLHLCDGVKNHGCQLNEHFPFLESDMAPSTDLITTAVCCSARLCRALAFFPRCIHHNTRQMQRDGRPQQDGALISVHREAPSDSFISLSATCCRLATNVPHEHNWPSQSPSPLGLGQMACSTMKNVPKFDTDKRTAVFHCAFSFFSHVCPAVANTTGPSEIVHKMKSVMFYDSQIIGLR